MPNALITGVAGQDGAYLTDLLLSRGYTVYGIARHASERNTWRIKAYVGHDRFRLLWGDVLDPGFVARCVDRAEPDEVYNLAAQSDVASSFEIPDYTIQVNTLATARLLDILHRANSKARFYQASTSELFGDSAIAQSESTPMRPMSPYAAAKLAAFWMVRTYRDAYGMHASNGILFNHESPLRAECFVTRKIAIAVARIRHTLSATGMMGDALVLGNLDARRDWGHAMDFVRGMWMMLQEEKPDDYVLATGETHSVREFVERAFRAADMAITWQGDRGVLIANNRIVVKTDPAFKRPLDVPCLHGDASKAERVLGWVPVVKFSGIVQEMVDVELERISAR